MLNNSQTVDLLFNLNIHQVQSLLDAELITDSILHPPQISNSSQPQILVYLQQHKHKQQQCPCQPFLIQLLTIEMDLQLGEQCILSIEILQKASQLYSCIIKELNRVKNGNQWYTISNFISLAKYNQPNFTIEQLYQISKQILLLIYFRLGIVKQPSIQQSKVHKQIINFIISMPTISEALSVQFGQLYLLYCKQIVQVTWILQMLELLHCAYPYPKSVLLCDSLLSHVEICLLNEHCKVSNSLGVNVYGCILHQKGTYTSQDESFLNLYSTVRCFGSHLIKDIWQTFYTLVNTTEPLLLPISNILHILLTHIHHHENANVTRYCILDILTHPSALNLFKYPQLVYNNLFNMLNIGLLYLDCLYHLDSHMLKTIPLFFRKYYNTLSSCQLQSHLSFFFEALCHRITFQHALVGLIGVFSELKVKSRWMGVSQIKQMCTIIRKYYNRLPIRKRIQLMKGCISMVTNHLNTQKVTLLILMSTFIANIPKQYMQIICSDRIISLIQTHFSIQKQEQYFITLLQNPKNINLIQLSFTILKKNINSQQFVLVKDRLIQLYSSIYAHTIKISQSSYKSVSERLLSIQQQYEIFFSIQEQLTFQQIIPHFNKLQFIEASLNNVALVINSLQGCNVQQSQRTSLCQVVHYLCMKAYSTQYYQNKVIIAKFIEWSIDSIQSADAAICLIHTLKAKVASRKPQPIEECLYHLMHTLLNEPTLIQGVSEVYKIRLIALMGTIMSSDQQFVIQDDFKKLRDELSDMGDRYDFQHYDQLFQVVGRVYAHTILTEDIVLSIQRLITSILQATLHTLDYGITKKEVISISQACVDILFSYASIHNCFHPSLVALLSKLLEIGDNYWMFHRVLSVYFCNSLQNFANVQICFQQLIPFIRQLACVEQYRGYDSCVILQSYCIKFPIYNEVKIMTSSESDYEGVVVRFLLLLTVSTHRSTMLMKSIVKGVLPLCLEKVDKQKMFLIDKHKIKLKLWQLLLTFPVRFFLHDYTESLQQMILLCLKSVQINNISEVKFYAQLFLMRIIINNEYCNILNQPMIEILLNKMLENTKTYNISYMVISGLIIHHLSDCINKKHECKWTESLQQLYKGLLILASSHVAYIRGISQYFCFSLNYYSHKSRIIQIMKKVYDSDSDSRNMSENISVIILQYMQMIENWQPRQNLYPQRVIVNNNITNPYYIEQLKSFNKQLQIKPHDGFQPYQQIHKHIDKVSIQTQSIQQICIFQRKIDPTIDYLYLHSNHLKPHLQLRILIASSKKTSLYGHVSRTGEIFGIQELIIPSKGILNLEDYKNVSCTAEKWLKIVDLNQFGSHEHQTKHKLHMALSIHHLEGYQIVQISDMVSQSSQSILHNLPQKCLLLIDEENIIDFSARTFIHKTIKIQSHLSFHVQIAIFIWYYYLKSIPSI